MSELLRLEREGGVARITLARPEVRNAFNAALIAELTATFGDLADDPPDALRAVVLAGDGATFCAGADVTWMRASLQMTAAQNEADAARLAEMLEAIDDCPVPVIARVHGAALGGGMGLCAVADVVLATADAAFGFTETRLGIVPAVISPFVLRRIGEGAARALFPTGERFGAERARQIGLVQEVLPDAAALDARVDEIVEGIRAAGPTAVRAAKAVIRDQRDLDPARARQLTVEAIARQRTSAEGQEGLTAFLEKRPPTWRT
ncbi:MAG TPA: enoyl-CoA hydratase-related protein [Candidatus Limnocylindria bacterium]|jgi:methylglutaconyl-CoA hydratase|nr:enoyl-CoA hydratase-related protein [Candidatus Limnocylindria bacterium]